jgi:hypothetical protein
MAIQLNGIHNSTGFKMGTATLSDPYFANVSLLLHGEGTNGSTTFTDSSSLSKTILRGGTPQISTTRSKIGNASILFNASGYNQSNYLYTTNLTNFTFPGDFTIECWIYPVSMGATWGSFILDTRDTSGSQSNTGWIINYGYAANGNKIGFGGNSAGVITSNVAPTLNVWTNIAVVRSGSVIKMYVNGVAQTQTLTDSTSYNSQTFNMGRSANNASTTGIAGNVDEVRITKGIARYTANFTPLSTPFPDQ